MWHQLEEGPHPGPHFPQTLKALRQVEVINFGDCLVRSKGAVAIADAVHGGLPKLKVLAGWLPPPSGVQAPPRSGWQLRGQSSCGGRWPGLIAHFLYTLCL